MTHQIRETLFNHVCTKFLRQSHCKMKMEQRENCALAPHALGSEAGFSNHNNTYQKIETAGFVNLGVWLWWHTRPGNSCSRQNPQKYILLLMAPASTTLGCRRLRHRQFWTWLIPNLQWSLSGRHGDRTRSALRSTSAPTPISLSQAACNLQVAKVTSTPGREGSTGWDPGFERPATSR